MKPQIWLIECCCSYVKSLNNSWFVLFIMLFVTAFMTMPNRSNAQALDDLIWTTELPPYILEWTELSPSDSWSSPVFRSEDNLEIDIDAFVNAIETEGSVFLPAGTKQTLCSRNLTSCWHNEYVFRKYTLIDRWTAEIWDGNVGAVGAMREYEVFTFQGPNYSAASAVITGNKMLLVQPFDHFWTPFHSAFQRQMSHGLFLEEGSMAHYGDFRPFSDGDVLPSAGPSPFPEALGMGCGTVEPPATAGMLPPNAVQAPALVKQSLALVRTSLALSPAILGMIDEMPMDIDASMWSASYTALANSILIPDVGVALRHALTFPIPNEIVVTPDSSLFNPDFLTEWEVASSTSLLLTDYEANLVAGGVGYQPVHAG